MTDRELTNEMIKRADEFVEKQKREFAIAELKKIKKEILKHYCTICWVDLRVCMQKYHCETCKGFAEIIDKHISELKEGEEDGI